MEIVNVRIDSRLIHGQVAAMWTGVLKATRIMVIDNMVVKNEMMKRMLKMACPGGLKLSILNTETASENIKSKDPADRIFVIVKQPETLLELVQFGFPLEEVTVGNINSTRGSRQIRKTICVTPQDEEVFHTLADKGIKLTAQMVPTEEKTDLMKLL